MGPRSGYSHVKPGTRVPASAVSAQSFADSKDGFGLADVGYETVPARTVNGGETWSTDGPIFTVPAADGAEGVHYTGVAGDRTEFAYGSSAVDITTNGGHTWWQSFLGELVVGVTFQNDRLIAFVQQQTTARAQQAVTWVYISKDGGEHWRFNNQLGAF